jgi:PPOX class probable F420-dependent enzyme
MLIDSTTEFGQRVVRRLKDELIIWLTTVDQNHIPQPRPIAFWWDGETVLVYSKPNTYKVAHIARNPHVALHFDGDGQGGDIIVFTGEARVDNEAPPANRFAEYIEKYQPFFKKLQMTPDEFAEKYTAAIRIRPLTLRGH